MIFLPFSSNEDDKLDGEKRLLSLCGKLLFVGVVDDGQEPFVSCLFVVVRLGWEMGRGWAPPLLSLEISRSDPLQ